MTAVRAVGVLGKLVLGLVLFGVGLWLGLVAELGVGPWDVLTGGLADLLGTSFGRTAILVSVVVLLVAVAVGVRPGVGTVLDVVVIGVAECAVLVVGVLLGGPVGIGTVLFAFTIGPAVQLAFRLLRQSPVRPPSQAVA